MSDIEEVKKLFGDTQRVAEEARAKADDIAKKAADFVDNASLRKMQDDLAAKFAAMDAKQAEIKAKTEALETAAARPGKVDGNELSPESKAFRDYLAKGAFPADERKDMSTGSNPDGGYLVPDVMRAGIQKRLRLTSPVRAVANVVSFIGGSYDILVERGDAGSGWVGELSTRSETDTPTINRISISLHELAAMPKVSQRLLDNASFDIEGWLTGYVADKFARDEATAFISGNGVARPKGFLSYPIATTVDASRAAETLQYRATGTSGAFDATNPADVLIRTFYDLNPGYQANAAWMMANSTMALVAIMRDSNGYLLREILNGDGSLVRTIQGRPAYSAEDMPAIGANSVSVALGDFGMGYTIVENPGITVLRDPFSAKPNVLFYTTKRVGGGVSDFDAIKLIRFSTT
jgi:HK97 family phage major capsid protein